MRKPGSLAQRLRRPVVSVEYGDERIERVEPFFRPPCMTQPGFLPFLIFFGFRGSIPSQVNSIFLFFGFIFSLDPLSFGPAFRKQQLFIIS